MRSDTSERFIKLFDDFDYSDGNRMHTASAQVKDGILCRDVDDRDHFYLLDEWANIKMHAEIREELAGVLKPEFLGLTEGRAVRTEVRGDRVEHAQAILDRASR